jgi:hypothetical protein
MKKTLTPIAGQMAIIIEKPILDLLGIDSETQLKLSTDGRRLVIEPVGSVAPEASAPRLKVTNFTSRAVTVELMNELIESFAMTNEHFRQLHPWGDRASLTKHLNYSRDGETFQPGSPNPAIARRLHTCLEQLRKGHSWQNAIAAALKKDPIG